MSRMLRFLVSEDAGQDLVEYALLAAFLAVVSVAVLRVLGVSIRNVFTLVYATIGKTS